jgi:chemotaxis protein methyltransferase CheR
MPGTVAEAEELRSLIAQRLGLRFEDAKLGFLREVLIQRAKNLDVSLHEYLGRLKVAPPDVEIQALAADVTVSETYFFRHMDQFRAFVEVVLPDAARLRAHAGPIRILSAGCATGEEPYSLAMLARERSVCPPQGLDIRAIDINPAVVARAIRGLYSAWALREMPADSQMRWFKASGKDFELDADIRNAVAFRVANLADTGGEVLAPNSCEVIFCRNVLMYFTPHAAQAMVQRLTAALVPGGYLFLGHAETLRGLSDDYHLCHTHGTFYYQRRGVAGSTQTAWQDNAADFAKHDASIDSLHLDAAAIPLWPRAIEQATDRIRALAERTARPAPPSRVPSPRIHERPQRFQRALEYLKEERFAEALEVLEDPADPQTRDADGQLLRGVLLAHSGRMGEAERVAGGLLSRGELNPGAHYLLALCRDHAGDQAAAVRHDQTAVYLDAGFAMPRLHLGLMARRQGDRDGARHELAEALELLRLEEDSRLILFGGGFGREALIALCEAELTAVRGVV